MAISGTVPPYVAQDFVLIVSGSSGRPNPADLLLDAAEAHELLIGEPLVAATPTISWRDGFLTGSYDQDDSFRFAAALIQTAQGHCRYFLVEPKGENESALTAIEQLRWHTSPRAP